MRLARRLLGSPWALESVWGDIEQSNPVREKPLGPVDLPLGDTSKHVMAFAAEEADTLRSKSIGTSHLFLGFLREEKSFCGKDIARPGCATRVDSRRIRPSAT